MAVQRYETIEKRIAHYYSPTCPISLEAYAILFDTIEQKYGVQLKFQNCSSKKIGSVIVSIKTYDHFGELTEEVQDFQYVNINSEYGEVFGTKTLLPLSKNVRIKELTVAVIRIAFINGDIWNSDGNDELTETIKLNELSTFIPADVLLDYRNLINQKMRYIPFQEDHLWVCSCGAVNFDAENCNSCGAKRSEVFDYLLYDKRKKALEERIELHKEKTYSNALFQKEQNTKDSLQSAIISFSSLDNYKNSKEQVTECQVLLGEIIKEEEKLAELARTKREEERNKSRKKKQKTLKTIIGIFTIVLICLMLLSIVTQIIIPNLNYRNAKEYMENGQYEEAMNEFQKLGDYKNSKEMAEEAEKEYLYTLANAYFNEKEFEKAYSTFDQLDGFKDSKDRSKESRYQEALRLLDIGVDNEAYTLLSKLEHYKETDTYLASFVAIPTTVTWDNQYDDAQGLINFNYDNDYKLDQVTARVATYEVFKESNDPNIFYSFNDSGYVVSKKIDFPYHKEEFEYTYNEDGTVRRTPIGNSSDDYTIYDEYGNVIEDLWTDIEYADYDYYEKEVDEYHNKISNKIENTYENGTLINIAYTQSQYSKILSSISYEYRYDPDLAIDIQAIMKNLRLICSEDFYDSMW